MKKYKLLLHPVVVFVSAHLAWLSLLGLWIYWYVSNYIIFETVGNKLSPQLAAKKFNVVALVAGLFFLVALLVGIYLIFIYLNKQRNLNKLYDNFIANVTHELKSPLASIQLYLETMNMREVPPARQREFIQLMLKDANRLKHRIQSILEISGLEQKSIAHNFHVHDVESVVRRLISEAKEQFNIDSDSILVRGHTACLCVIDPDALRIVINNLIDNAIKYSVDPVKISIELLSSEKRFILKFTDNGIGLSPVAFKTIFEKFKRIQNYESPTVKGTGLGLYWVKEIIKYHGGSVSVFSRGKMKGTTFKLELPIYQSTKKRYINYLLKLTRKQEKKQIIDNV